MFDTSYLQRCRAREDKKTMAAARGDDDIEVNVSVWTRVETTSRFWRTAWGHASRTVRSPKVLVVVVLMSVCGEEASAGLQRFVASTTPEIQPVRQIETRL